jgi:putative transposase
VEERKAVIGCYVARGMSVAKAASIAGMSKSSYYYKPTSGKPGRRPAPLTMLRGWGLVSNATVMDSIEKILSVEFMENGYKKVTMELKDRGYVINKKKVYRLMEEARLLNQRRKKVPKKEYVTQYQVECSQPFEILEIDLKYIYIRGERRNAYLISILDTFTRISMGWDLQYSIRHGHALTLIDQIIGEFLQDKRPPAQGARIILRSDNDSRFEARAFREHLHNNCIDQTFIQPATPQQNGHIESFHSIVEELVCSRFEFENLKHARDVFQRFFHTYNHRRTIAGLLYLPPMVFLQQWENGNIGMEKRVVNGKKSTKFFFRGKRPEWLSSAPEELVLSGQNKIMSNSYTFEPVS